MIKTQKRRAVNAHFLACSLTAEISCPSLGKVQSHYIDGVIAPFDVYKKC